MQLKSLFAFLSIFISFAVFSQKVKLTKGDAWNYKYKENYTNDTFGDHSVTEMKISFLVKEKKQNGSYDIEMVVPAILFKDSSKNFNLVFNSAHPELNMNVQSSNAAFYYYFLLSQPLTFELSENGSVIQVYNLDKLIAEKINVWALRNDLKDNFAKGTEKTVDDILKAAFSRKPMLSSVGKNNTAQFRKPLHANKEKNGSTKSAENVGNANKEVFSFSTNLTNVPLKNDTAYNKTKADEIAYYDMSVRGSFFSDAISTQGFLDSNKVIKYINENNVKYKNDKDYNLNKLVLLQQIRNWERYESELKLVPLQQLTGSFHLSNRINDDNISDKDFDAIVPMLNNEQLYDWLQHNFSQSLSKNANRQKLNRLAHHALENVRISALPMQLWQSAAKNENNADSLTNIAKTFSGLPAPYWNQGNAGRYALLTYKIMADKNYKNAASFLENIKAKILPLYKDSLNDKRYIQKAHLAYAYYLDYLYNKNKDATQDLKMLAQAAYYSPKSNAEKAYDSFYDRAFLKSEENYTETYYAVLAKSGKKEEALQAYISEFINNPSDTYANLKSFYEQAYKENSFSSFFNHSVLPQLPDAPLFELTNINDEKDALKDSRGKWLLIDFWGTWCSPCVAEIPELNNYYNQLLINKNEKIRILSIACRDTKERVISFQKKHNYNFPVLMSDTKIEKLYKIPGYPTKMIISPAGKMIPVYFGSDWKGLLEEMALL